MMDHGANIIINLGLHHRTILESHANLMASEINADKNLKRAAIKTLELIHDRKLDNAYKIQVLIKIHMLTLIL